MIDLSCVVLKQNFENEKLYLTSLCLFSHMQTVVFHSNFLSLLFISHQISCHSEKRQCAICARQKQARLAVVMTMGTPTRSRPISGTM